MAGSARQVRESRPFRAGYVAGGMLVLGIVALLVYAFWPMLTGESTEAANRPVVEASPARTLVEAIVVQRRGVPLRAEATGRLAPWRQAEISAETSGFVRHRHVEEGQRVPQNAVLLRLDDRAARIEMQEAEAALLKARIDYAVAMRTDVLPVPADTMRMARARAALLQAQIAFDRGELSLVELQRMRRRFETERELAGVDRGDVQAIVSGLVQAELRLERARLALSRTEVRAPFAGRVASVDVEEGQHAAAGDPLLVLLDDTRMKVEVDVLEADLVRLKAGARAWVRIPALADEIFEGFVHTINPRVEPATGTGRVTVVIPNPQGRLMAGLFAYVALEVTRLPDRLAVPSEAVLVRQGQDLVFRIEDGRVNWVYVTVGERSGDDIVIREGLRPGDTIAVGGHFALAHEAPVEVVLVEGNR
ncbi:efflux transporter periplasmic adaptor subunit [Rhodothermaceae bacterium RA]|nr:efflux transporter periplasmic adaptor subunit [Rhodothermaceae bacterium RA]